jgi:hypothetical protein
MSLKSVARERLMSVGHYLTAVVLALKALTYVSHEPVPWGFVLLCLLTAAMIVVVTFFHHRIAPRFPAVHGLIYLAEGLVCTLLAHHTHAEGKTGLPWAWGLAAALLLARGLWELFRRGGHRRPAVH